MRADFDRELRVFARSASDDKGPIGMFLADFDLIWQQQLKPAINVKVILDIASWLNRTGSADAGGATA